MKNALLTLEDVAERAPSALTRTHDGKRSDRYTFVPTREIISRMADVGWGVSRAMAPRARKENSREFGKHMIAFRQINSPGIPDPRQRVLTHGTPDDLKFALIFPEILAINSSNGASRFVLRAGLFCRICANGAVISLSSFGEMSMRHSGFEAEDAYRISTEFTGRMDKIGDSIQRFQSINLTRERQLEYATEAARIRWDDNIPDANTLLLVRRPQDSGDDLWTVYNKVQEHVIRGGQKLGHRTSRELSNIDRNIDINSRLWDLTEAYALN